MRGASKNLVWGALKHIRGASGHHSMGVLRGTLDRGPLKHQIGSCIWDTVKDPIRSFRASFVLRVLLNFSNHDIFTGAVGLHPIIWRFTHFGLTLSNFRECLLIVPRCTLIFLIN